MKLVEALTIIGLIAGPILAVLISLGREENRRIHERRFNLLSMLLSTRHLPADPQYSAAINLIPAVFHDVEPVLKAWRQYHTIVNQTPTPAEKDAHIRRMVVKQAQLIFSISENLGLGLAEGDIQLDAYIASANTARNERIDRALAAMERLAQAMETQVTNTEELIALARRGQPQTSEQATLVPRVEGTR